MRTRATSIGPSTGLAGWITHRLVANYWFLALCAVVAAPLVMALSLVADRAGATAWLLDHDLAPVRTADAAQEVVGVVAAIDAAFITLYFSISLIVLTIAAGNLGVRLVDRWLGRRLVRVSIGGLSFSLVFAVLTLAAIDSEAGLAQTPLATVTLTIVLLGVNVAMLAVALHDLGRTMFVDKAINSLAFDASVSAFEVTGREAFSGDFAQSITAPRDGYVEGIDLDYLARQLADHEGAIRICVAPGQHVLAGEPLAKLERAVAREDEVLKSIPVGPFRSDSQGSVFQIRLLVEIAARALSPAVNDFYTALAAADALAEVMVRHAANWVGEDAGFERQPRIRIAGAGFRGIVRRSAQRLQAGRCRLSLGVHPDDLELRKDRRALRRGCRVGALPARKSTGAVRTCRSPRPGGARPRRYRGGLRARFRPLRRYVRCWPPCIGQA